MPDGNSGTRTSSTAIASFVLGLQFCIPLLPAMLAIFLGLIALRRISSRGLAGRGLAFTGILLGLLGLLAWVPIGYGTYSAVQRASQAVAAAMETGNLPKIASPITLEPEVTAAQPPAASAASTVKAAPAHRSQTATPVRPAPATARPAATTRKRPAVSSR